MVDNMGSKLYIAAMSSIRSKPAAALGQSDPRAGKFRRLEIVLVDGSVLESRPYSSPRNSSFKQSALSTGQEQTLPGASRAESAPEKRNLGETMDQPQAKIHVPADESEIFRQHYDGDLWHWTYHDHQGRLLVRGSEHADRWTAHRELLSTIADYCTRGETGDEEEDDLAANEEPAPNGAVVAAESSNAPDGRPEAIEPPLANCERRSA
jgi:hypothetical protein